MAMLRSISEKDHSRSKGLHAIDILTADQLQALTGTAFKPGQKMCPM